MRDPTPNLGPVGGRSHAQVSNESDTADCDDDALAASRNRQVKPFSRQEPVSGIACMRWGLLRSNPWLTPMLSHSRCLQRWSVTVWAGTTNRHRAAESSSEPGCLALYDSGLFDSLLLPSDFGRSCCRVVARDVFTHISSLRKPLCPNSFLLLLQFSSPAPLRASATKQPAALSMRERSCICTPRTKTAVKRRWPAW